MTNETLTKKEIRRIRNFYLLPAIAGACLAVAFGLGLFVIAGEMINDLVFYAHGFLGWGLYFYIVVVIVYMVLFIAGMLIPRFGMMGKKWKETCVKVSASQAQNDYSKKAAAAVGTMAAARLASRSDNNAVSTIGNVGQVIGGIEITEASMEIASEMMSNAKAVAQAANVKLPSPGKTIATLIIAPILILCAIYAAEFMHSTQAMEANLAKSVQTFEALESAFSGTAIDEDKTPSQGYNDSGYTFRAYINSQKDTETYVLINVDYDGTIDSLSYYANVDINEPEAILENRVKADFATLNGCVAKLDKSLSDKPEMLANCELPDDFWNQFKAGTYYDKISGAVNRDDGIRVYYNFYTDTQEKMNKYTKPYISLSCK